MQYLAQEITAFTSSTITETIVAYNPATAYTIGDEVLVDPYIYKCVAACTGKSPITFIDIFWVKWSTSNKMAMLDLSSQSKSIMSSGNLVVEFLQGGISTLGIGNYEADHIQVDILASDGTTVLWTHNTISSASTNLNTYTYYNYVYDTYIETIERSIKIDLGAVGYKVRVTFVGTTRTACGFLYGGNPVGMGQTLYGVKFGFNSFALKETDDFGTLTITKRAVQDIVDFETIINTNQLMRLRSQVKKVYNDIMLFILDETDGSIYDNMLVLGTIESVNIVLSNPKITTMTWSVVEGI